MKLWKIGAGVATALVAYKIWKAANPPYAGNVATGNGGNYTGNLPAIVNPKLIVGSLSNGQPIFGPSAASPSVPFVQASAGTWQN